MNACSRPFNSVWAVTSQSFLGGGLSSDGAHFGACRIWRWDRQTAAGGANSTQQICDLWQAERRAACAERARGLVGLDSWQVPQKNFTGAKSDRVWGRQEWQAVGCRFHVWWKKSWGRQERSSASKNWFNQTIKTFIASSRRLLIRLMKHLLKSSGRPNIVQLQFNQLGWESFLSQIMKEHAWIHYWVSMSYHQSSDRTTLNTFSGNIESWR